MSQMYEELRRALFEAIAIERGEIRVVPHPAQNILPAPTFVAEGSLDADKKSKKEKEE